MFWGKKRHFLGTAPGVQVCSAHGGAALYRGAPLLGVSRVLPDPERFSCPVLCTNKPSVLHPALPGAPRGICLCPAPGPCCSPDPVGSSGWHGAHAPCRGAGACATAAATETQSCQHSVSFSKAPCPEARGWGREEISRCWISSFSSYKGAVGLLLPVASVLVGIFSLHFPAGEPQSSQCPSLGFFLVTSAALSKARVLKAFAPSVQLPRFLSWSHHEPVALGSPSIRRRRILLFLHPAARAGG